MLDHRRMEERLAAAPTAFAPGPPAYHAFTFGWLAAGLARRVTGQGMRHLVQTELAEPLGTTGLEIGYPAKKPAQVTGSSLRLLTAAGTVGMPLLMRVPNVSGGVRALHVPGFARLIRGRDPDIWRTEMPAANGALSGHGLARLYAPLANGGRAGDTQFLSAETVNEMGRVQTRAVDRVLGFRMRWRLGYHHGFTAGPPAPRAFGHYGFGGCGGWADPDSGLSLGFVCNDIGTVTSPIGDLALLRLSALARRCARGGPT